jgi:hypothetical protein
LELIGITRNGKEEFVACCPNHNYYYNGRPPLTTGCPDCWEAYYFCQVAQSKNIKESVDQLDLAVRHAAELEDKGEWDFVPDFHVKIEKEN